MRLGYRLKLNAYEARALCEDKGYKEAIERKIKACVVDAAKQFVQIQEIVDPERPKPSLEELTKPTEYSTFPEHSSDLYPEYDATLHVYSEETMRQIKRALKNVAESGSQYDLRNNCRELWNLLNS